MSEAAVRIALRVGVELVVEPWPDSNELHKAFHDASDRGSLDGGLAIVCDGAVLSRIETWDQVDALLLAWCDGLAALTATGEIVVVFPDTRIECLLERQADGRVRASYEDIDICFEPKSLAPALAAATDRLLAAARQRGCVTPALAQWMARADRGQGERP